MLFEVYVLLVVFVESLDWARSVGRCATEGCSLGFKKKKIEQFFGFEIFEFLHLMTNTRANIYNWCYIKKRISCEIIV